MKYLVFAFACLSAAAAWANQPTEQEVDPTSWVGIEDGEHEVQGGKGYTGSRLYSGKGTHTCWSRAALWTCNVEGKSYVDCNYAYYNLKAMSCCGAGGGVSSNFVLTSCSMF
jgi:hypothetical protein